MVMVPLTLTLLPISLMLQTTPRKILQNISLFHDKFNNYVHDGVHVKTTTKVTQDATDTSPVDDEDVDDVDALSAFQKLVTDYRLQYNDSMALTSGLDESDAIYSQLLLLVSEVEVAKVDLEAGRVTLEREKGLVEEEWTRRDRMLKVCTYICATL